jgi:catechol 1,2-dioxygenase
MSSSAEQSPAWAVDESRIVPRAVELTAAFREAMAGLVREHGLTFEEMATAVDAVGELAKSGPPLSLALMPLYGNVFQVREGEYTRSDVEGPAFVPDAPLIGNPGVLPMRADEAGIPLIASGQVRAGDGSPLAGAELNIYQAAMNGQYSGLGLDDQPEWNLRARQLTDSEGRYQFRGITSPPYALAHLPIVHEAAAALGRSTYRPAHIHFAIRHPDLVLNFANEIYFKGDPTIEHDVLSPGFAAPDLQAELVHHDDPEEIAEQGLDGPFNTLAFDFILKTKADVARGE